MEGPGSSLLAEVLFSWKFHLSTYFTLEFVVIQTLISVLDALMDHNKLQGFWIWQMIFSMYLKFNEEHFVRYLKTLMTTKAQITSLARSNPLQLQS